MQRFDLLGNRIGVPLNLNSASSRAAGDADPVISALPGNVYAVAWTAMGTGTDVVIRRVAPDGVPMLSDPVLVHDHAAGAQGNADLLWVDGALLVSWTDGFSAAYRRLDADLNPLDAATQLASGALLDDAAVLAPFRDSFALAWRAGGEGPEEIVVWAAGQEWRTEPLPAGPVEDRPSLLELDAEHLLLVFSAGRDPIDNGASEIRYAVLGVGEPGLVSTVRLAPQTSPFSGAALSQSAADLVPADGDIYVSWQAEGPAGDPLRTENFLQRLEWSEADPSTVVVDIEVPLAPEGLVEGHQYRPGLAKASSAAGDALVAVWEDHDGASPNRPVPDLMLLYRPLPGLAR